VKYFTFLSEMQNFRLQKVVTMSVMNVRQQLLSCLYLTT